jgi:hypothetical protein
MAIKSHMIMNDGPRYSEFLGCVPKGPWLLQLGTHGPRVETGTVIPGQSLAQVSTLSLVGTLTFSRHLKNEANTKFNSIYTGNPRLVSQSKSCLSINTNLMAE